MSNFFYFIILSLIFSFSPAMQVQATSRGVEKLWQPEKKKTSLVLSKNYDKSLQTSVGFDDNIEFNKNPYKLNRFTSSKAYQMLEVPLILASIGMIYMPFDNQFHSVKKTFIPSFHYTYDDYIQYLPAAVMLGLKIGGVKSRSSWGHMLTADAFSVAIVLGLVNGLLKPNVDITRPDGSANNSFPSGHTATAFMTATMLHKEYGQKSPWYSIGAYSVATATGLARMMNNRHWISDVLVGAAIGIISVELGYFISDLIFRKHEKDPMAPSNLFFTKDHRPSFISLYTGVNVNVGKYSTSMGRDLSLDSGGRIGIEGAWYMNPYIGIGGQFIASTSFLDIAEETTLNTLGLLNLSTGAYFSYPLSPIWRVGTKALVGVSYAYIRDFSPSVLRIDDYNIGFHTGVSISYFARRNLGFKAYADYSCLPSFIGDKTSNEFTFGASVELLF